MSTGNNTESADERPEFFTIGEVSDRTGIKTSVLRFWEKEFEGLRPKKNKFGHRAYTLEDIELIIKIKGLLYEEGHTIKGAKKLISETSLKVFPKIDSAKKNDIKSKLLEILSILNEGRK
jgi:DNA-binding transcriptional MerR regulator